MEFDKRYDTSMLDFLRESRRDTGNRDVWSYYGSRESRDDFYLEIDRLATFFSDHNLTNGKNIAICLPNIPNAVVAAYAVNKVGAVADIIHPLIPSEGLRHILEHVHSSALFIFDLFFEQHRAVIEELGIPTIVCSARDYMNPMLSLAVGIATRKKTHNITYNNTIKRYKDIIKTEPHAIHQEIRGEDIAIFLHSGGTMGESKTVMLSNRAINALADKTRALIGGTTTAEDGMLMVLPLFHGFGLGVCMHTTLCASCRMVMMPQFNAKKAIDIIKRERVSYIAGVPTMYDKMMNEPSFRGPHLKTLKHCYCGGDKLTADTKERFDEIMREAGNPISINEGYGLTEVVSVCSVSSEEEYRFPSVGRGLKGVEFKIIDEQGKSLPIGESGEICVYSDSMMTGYYDDEESTRLAMQEDETGKVWIRTGDIGYLDADGYLYFKDRLKRMVKISGMNVFPKEIEEIAERLPDIKIASAVESRQHGKPMVKLLVVMNDGYTFGEDVENRIRTAISSELMKYSVPKVIEERERLPLTLIGKVDYRLLQEEENKRLEE